MKVNPKIFRVYDVRGVYPGELNEDVFYNLGVALVSYLKKPKSKIVVGRDLRGSSESLSKSFVEALVDFGCRVVDLGVITTPMFYFAAGFLGSDGGAMITASHNPPEYNGVKFVKKGSVSVSGEEIKSFYSENIEPAGNVKGKIEKVDISEAYLKEAAGGFRLSRGIKIKVDDGGGAAKFFLPRFLEKLGVVPISSGEDLSVSFDFDADRLNVFSAEGGSASGGDENGQKIRGDVVGGIIADDFVEKGQKMIIDIVSTKMLEDYFSEKGVEVYRSPVGHYFIKKIMREIDAVFALEISGHYYFKDFYYSDSAFFALRKILEALDKNRDKNISELARPFQKYFHSGEINLPLRETEEWGSVSQKVKEKYQDGKQKLKDGISVEYPDFWFNLRPSNTEPLMRLVVEAKSEELMEEKKKELMSFLK